MTRAAAAEPSRHAQIDTVIEATVHRALYQIVDDQDFTDSPRPYGDGEPGAGIAGERPRGDRARDHAVCL